jgi:hypothetical protein
MALVKGVNCPVDVAEADAYFENRLDAAAWTESLLKDQALTTATMVFENLPWIGSVLDVEQPFAFPRMGCYFDNRLGQNVVLGDELPKRYITGLFELAYHLLNNDGILDDTGGVIDLELGDISLNRISNPNLLPRAVKSHIKCLLQSRNSWWRAN